jgi:hypothetical protein
MMSSRSLLRGLLGFVALCGLVQAKEPKVGVTRFKNIPSRISYFDDTTVSLCGLVGSWHAVPLAFSDLS